MSDDLFGMFDAAQIFLGIKGHGEHFAPAFDARPVEIGDIGMRCLKVLQACSCKAGEIICWSQNRR